ncbi:uncharacterized protein LOC142977116 [Anticarsia gemmatalis]|uniref:uncharacterized protein LOC142977116 n=1 Tax=Anticarsia gemmatalis TaxID=129554 RepID=UPI003F76344E
MGIELPRYNKCCCCIPLRIGSLIIGYVSIFASCLTLAMVSWSIYKVATFVDTNKDKPNPEHPPDELAKTALGLYISFAYYQLVFLYSLIIGVILVIGVHRNKPNYLRFYFNATLFLFALGLALVVITCIFMGFLATVPVLKWCFTLLCCMVIVRSYYLQLEEEQKRPVEMTEYELQPYVAQAPLMA